MKLAIAVVGVLSLGSFAPASATPQAPVIALSNAYYGNTWRHQMVEAFEAAAKQERGQDRGLHRDEWRWVGCTAEQPARRINPQEGRRAPRRRRFRNRRQWRDREGVQGGNHRDLVDSRLA